MLFCLKSDLLYLIVRVTVGATGREERLKDLSCFIFITGIEN